MEHTALFIIDLQEGQLVETLKPLVRRIEALQSRYAHLAVFSLINEPDSPWVRWLHWTRFQKGSPESKLAFAPLKHAVFFEKRRYSCLHPDVLEWLKTNNIRDVHLCGVRTENCVLKTAVDLFETNQFRPVILADYCGSVHTDLHDAALKIIEKFIGKDQIIYDRSG